MSHFVLFHWIMMQIFIAHAASEVVVRAVVGQSARLPCYYQVARHKDISDMCWGRGPCPNSKCNNKILHTTGNRVTFRQSKEYNLWGFISHGDVSLTIRRVKAEDAGTYCCRVEIPGWFNDIKQNIQLEVVTAPPVMTTTTTRKTTTRRFRRTTVAPPTTSDPQTTVAPPTTSDRQTTEIAVLLTTTIPEAKAATTESPPVIILETTAPPTFAVTENDAFQETTVAISTSPDFSTVFQAHDMRTEDDDMLFPTESVPLPGVTTELITAEETESAHTSLTVEDLPVTEISMSPDGKAGKRDDSGDKFPSHAILIACLTAASILFILMLSLLFWKRKHTKKFIMKSLRPAGDLEKSSVALKEKTACFPCEQAPTASGEAMEN